MIVDPTQVRAHVERWLKQGRRSRQEILDEKLTAIADMVSRHPHYFRFFGPYWWVVKALIRKHIGGRLAVGWAGDYDDGVVRRRYETGDALYDTAAALLYQADHSGNWVDSPQRHEIVGEGGADDETETYELFDPDVPTEH